jgi:hypothetical protein
VAEFLVKRRILHNGDVYLPGSTIKLTDAQAARMKNGQIGPVPAVKEEEPAKPAASDDTGKSGPQKVPDPAPADAGKTAADKGNGKQATQPQPGKDNTPTPAN